MSVFMAASGETTKISRRNIVCFIEFRLKGIMELLQTGKLESTAQTARKYTTCSGVQDPLPAAAAERLQPFGPWGVNVAKALCEHAGVKKTCRLPMQTFVWLDSWSM